MSKKTVEKITITSALPYVNGIKHLGNIIGSLLPADIFHRFMNIFGVQNIFICGTDEHGAQTEIAAMMENIPVEEYTEKYYRLQKEIYEKWHFDFTFFGRTSSKTHSEITKKFFEAIHKNGFIVEDVLLLPFCKKCKKYLADRYIEGTCPNCKYSKARGDQCESCGKLLDPIDLIQPRCIICEESEITFKKEKHLFLDLSKLEPALKRWILKNRHWPTNTRNFALGWLKEGLKPRCITRNLEWGIKVPLKNYSHLVFYVWFDAPIGYLSITKDAQIEEKLKNWEDWWKEGKSKVYHFLGKDNIPFHTIFWPGILIAARSKSLQITLPYCIAGYEYLNWEGQKFSTSRGVGLFSDRALDLFPADYWRYYLACLLPEKKDSNFEWLDFQNRINNELIASYGNLFYRITSFIEKFFGKIPRPLKPGKQEDDLVKFCKKSVDKIEKLVKKVKLRNALMEIMALSNEINMYLQIKEPWFTIKNKATKRDAATTLYYAVNALAVVSLLLYPYIPKTSKLAMEYLGLQKPKWKDAKTLNLLKPGKKIRPLILFQKIEDQEIEEAKKDVQSYQTLPAA